MGKSDDDFVAVNDAPTKTVTVRSFYMDETEITNAEYRQFVEWVRDSTVRLRLAILADEVGATPGDDGIGEFAFVDQENEEMTPYEQYMYDNYFGMGDDYYAGRKINRDIDLIWETGEYPDEYYSEVMDSMYIPEEESYNGQRTQPNIDVRLRIHEANIAGIQDGSWRIGASDLMPLEFASWTNEYVPGPYWPVSYTHLTLPTTSRV